MKIISVTLALVACAANSGLAQKVFRDRVEPHWFAGADGVTNQFWYRVNLPGGKSQFITVNAATGTREVAKTNFVADVGGLPVLRAPHPSGNSAADSEVTFDNRLTETVRLFWIDPSGGRVAYGTLRAGEKHTQHTFANHVWLVTGMNTNTIAVFEAEETTAPAIIDGRQPDGPRRRGPRNGNFRRANSARGDNSPDGKWTVFVRDHNLFLRELGTTNESQLTTDGCATNSYARNEQANRAIEMEYDQRDPESPTPEVFWSPDSKRLVAMRHQPGTDRRVYLIQSSPEDQLQPKLDSYPYLKPGDNVPIRKPHCSTSKRKRKFPSATSCSKIPGALTTCAGTRIRRGSLFCSTSAGIRRCACLPWMRRPAR